ncbi:glycosyltransferase family 2 protein [Paenibacillus ginsengarvi]|uniref:Glycosyltransferase n=1 Tax=Paenibacillus ginsengarvi TaxID=400777 RepID=A0A3B0CIX2_9BACL|nr:glycosyltransferase [Paenibacillus ginsengarvi]RKN85333.1 glycosyltransferase [Paenibacillus ginsengarvi]
MKLSVVMAVNNGAPYLQQAVASILAQTYSNFEFIIIDDGSTDRTWDIISSITDYRVKPFRLSANVGTPRALNTAVQLAEGDWIAVQDADDISLPDRLAVQSSYILARPELIAVGSKIACIGDEDGTTPERLQRVESNLNYGSSGEELFYNRYFVCPLCHGTAMYSKAHFMKAGGYEPAYRITHDYDLWLKLFQLGRIEKINRVLYQYRVHAASLSHRNGAATYTEKLLCCFHRISQYEFSRHPGLIHIIVFANDTLARWMESSIIPNCRVFVRSYFENAAKAEYALELWRSGEIDGIVLLKTDDRNALTVFFQRNGMMMNRNLFRL